MFKFPDFFYKLRFAVTFASILFCQALESPGQNPVSPGAQPSSSSVTAGEELNRGAEAYRQARYDDAIAAFRKAVELDPDSLMAKIYLGTALAQNVEPGLTTPENLRTADEAIKVFEQVLKKQPDDVNSMKQVASIYYAVKRLDEAREWQKKVLAVDPKDPDAAYTIGVIDWQKAYINALAALTSAGMNDDGKGNTEAPAEAMSLLEKQNGPLVEEAMHYLSLAIQLRPNYDDAMAYMNLVYRRRADLDRDNQAALADDLAKANEWSNKAMETRKANEEKKGAGQEPTVP
jgi:tetratricopeptide (TPR) repeat protein